MLTDLAGASALDHPLLVERENPKRAGVLVVSSDRGLCGGYNANVLRRAEELFSLLRRRGQEAGALRRRAEGAGLLQLPQPGGRPSRGPASPSSPTTRTRRRSPTTLVDGLHGRRRRRGRRSRRGRHPRGRRTAHRVHRVQVDAVADGRGAADRTDGGGVRRRGGQPVRTRCSRSSRMPTTLFDALLPRYIATRVYAALLEAAASESASRRRAMKSATDNADDLIKALTLEANRERQAQITQEISEIVGGANALADAASK